ncbi:sensor histidine kinase [Actinosynnema mirum]|uniref:histidine kinase n=1 Tax=Actinosynnema mirum (strain ATCC 29888 / DSM 43827 / JCM 3225 / NBRC 14064 / NCIMB 13271 / NRRL B-12336 / IMRU 3971 / 101) TaxID=446462 RepID=C6WGU4_ACTMD|nr:sensor histidine kinase [Actinosynnema mirum]ACU36012.1 ATP-binding region ATPase domain protein [Actinosynnema mirum DSM 43827]
MKQKDKVEAGTNQKTIRSRLTSVVVVPSVVLLVMWLAFTSYTVFDGFYTRAVAVSVKDASIPAVKAFTALQEERKTAMSVLAKGAQDLTALHERQRVVDEAGAGMRAAFDSVYDSAPDQVKARINELNALLGELPQRRAQVETGKVQRTEIYNYYNRVLDAGTTLFDTQARVVPDATAAHGGLTATNLFRAADWMSRSTSLAPVVIGAEDPNPEDRLELVNLIASYHSLLVTTGPVVEDQLKEHYAALTGSPEWATLSKLENDLTTDPDARIRLADWETAAGPVGERLIELAVQQATVASDAGLNRSNSQFITVLVSSLIALIVVLGGILTAVRTSNRLVNRALITRLVSLKNDSLTLAHERLPDIVDRLREGKHVDVEAEVPPLDYGSDEIGQVADAFNAAQFTAVAAAVKESQAREGVNRVFLDIAHRNQGLVHRQLKILDKLEREEENPEQLDALFQLDHLATRARRNAENLIILAGENPGRQWRKPVRLLDVLRAAVAETEQYVRVKVNPVPEVALVGASVADTIHLIAELVDNATAFSSPRSQVQIHASEVPQGVVVEIEDHGLGISPEDRDAHNAMLADPPEFDAMRLRGESRLGLFVVARLAARRGVHVELRESPYGGTLAMVLVPSSSVAAPNTPTESDTTMLLSRRSLHEHVIPRQHPDLVDEADEEEETTTFPDSSRELEGFWAQAEAAANEDSRAAEGRLSGGLDLSSHSGSLEPPRRTRPEPERERERPADTGRRRADAGGRPELPRRRRQQHIAPQLLRTDLTPTSEPLSEGPADQQSADQVRKDFSAFQRGTRDARRRDEAPES